MKKKILLFCILIYTCSYTQTVGLIEKNSGSLDDGYVLFAPILSTTTYLIDKCGKQVKTWPSTYRPGQSVYILPDGTLLRSGKINNTTFTQGGNGGIIQKIDWNGNVTWSYTISSTSECQHHDIKPLPNGNILAIVWESKTNTEAIAQGRNPSLTTATVWSEKIIEIQPVGTNGGNIVWEWYLWDHMVQDFDNTKPNFTTINTNPQLLNINYKASATEVDWIHLNSVDYNETLDQIILSSHSFSEVWIIDHSTTSAQAASHLGGNSGKGGDILYRWGNPAAYNMGTNATRKFWGQHDAIWINNGFPFANQVMVFNNGNGRIGGNYSTVEIINPPVSGFNYTATLPYLPTTTSWIYNDGNTNSYYAQNISGSQQLSNGNVLLCNGPSGTFTEVNTTGSIVWKYVNPVSQSGIINQGSTPTQNLVFRCGFYPSNYSGFAGQVLTPGSTIENSNVVSSSCSLVLATNENTISDSNIKIYPNPASELITIDRSDYFSNQNLDVQLVNSFGQVIYKANSIISNYTIPVQSYPEGVYFLIVSNNESFKSHKVIIKH
jgi:hypothetical protein